MDIRDAQPGDLIQLKDWFGDVWAEILFAYHHENSAFIGYVRRDKFGNRVDVNNSTIHKYGVWLGETIRKVSKDSDVNPRLNLVYRVTGGHMGKHYKGESDAG